MYETQWVTNLNGIELPLSATRKEFGHSPLMILGGEEMGSTRNIRQSGPDGARDRKERGRAVGLVKCRMSRVDLVALTVSGVTQEGVFSRRGAEAQGGAVWVKRGFVNC